MRIMTLNLQGFDDWNTRRPEILSHIKQTKPDIIFFQEVVFLPEVSLLNQVQDLNQNLGYLSEHSVVSRLQVGLHYPTYREGLAAVCKFPIIKTDTIALKKDPLDEHSRIIQFVDVMVKNVIVKFANVHFSLTDTTDFATAQLEEALAIIKSRDEERIIIGDFNINDLGASAAIWQDTHRASTEFDYVSYPGMNKRNDYALIPKSSTFTSLSVSGDTLSDHRALTVDVTIPHLSSRHRYSIARPNNGTV